ncbi:hypothetical protein [Desulfofalx alkaliphila]|uniref:hypothetical protein n=1 Tax=Desulfofalx alkaliphila TaxID=105483 RepID=UPI00068ECCD7|nr:hypothetical protein [Desulfofalx alkaliphila]
MEKSFPFNAVEVDGVPDRMYNAEDFARYFAQFISNGVYPNPSSGLQVQADGSMVVTVQPGSAYATGYGYVLTDPMQVSINTPDAAHNRKDSIVVRLDLTDRSMKLLYRPGTPATNPQAPAVVRTADIFDLQLAVVTVRSNTTSILPADVLDTRMNGNVCGIVSAVVDSVDTTTLFNQYENYLNQKMAEWDATKQQQESDWQEMFDSNLTEITAWYNSVKTDITLLQSFSFDNLAELKGCSKSTVFNPNGSISENIVKTVGGAKVADRVTVFNQDGSITVTTTAYEDDGQTVMKEATVTTEFNPDGSISEVVV